MLAFYEIDEDKDEYTLSLLSLISYKRFVTRWCQIRQRLRSKNDDDWQIDMVPTSQFSWVWRLRNKYYSTCTCTVYWKQSNRRVDWSHDLWNLSHLLERHSMGMLVDASNEICVYFSKMSISFFSVTISNLRYIFVMFRVPKCSNNKLRISLFTIYSSQQ